MPRLLLALLLTLATTAAQAQLDMAQLAELNIRNVGPANMSGRITTLDAVTANPKIIYAGAASGGIWKSDNGGTAWRPVGDDLPTQNIGAIRIQQSNPAVVWAGTGEGNPRNSMNLGQGIFKTIDGGKTWRSMGLEATKTIHRILVHPDDPDVVFAGAMGDPFTPNEHRGLYRTTDGGESWDKILYTNDQSGVADMVMDPKNPNKIFVALYEHRRTPYYFTSGGPGSGLYVTYDAGDTWRQLTAADGLPPGDLGRIGLAIAPSNPDRIYAKVEATKNALYRSDDGGDHWQLINDTPRYVNNRPFYFQELAVDPADPNRLYNIYQPLHLSYDGGKTFDPVPMIPADETKGVHADFHAFWVNPNDPKHFIIGGDGGLGITHDHGKSWYFPETMPVAQIYQVNVDEDMPYNVYCGMQDNGNWYGPGYVWRRGGIRTLYWQYLVGGDGFYISPDPEDAQAGYGTSQNGDLYRYDKIGGYYSSVQPPAPEGATLRFNWNAAFARDPFDANTVYSGSQFVHKSTDEGANWTVISPDLSTNNPQQQRGDYGGLTLDLSGAEMYNSILSIAPSSVDRGLIWAGTDDGQLHLTRDGGDNWTNLTARVTGLPKEAWIARVIASEHAAATAWLVVNNYRRGDYRPYLFRTDDFGLTWTNVIKTPEVHHDTPRFRSGSGSRRDSPSGRRPDGSSTSTPVTERSRGADHGARPTTLNESRSRGADLSPAPDHGAHSTTLSGVRSRGADQRARPTTLNESRSRGADLSPAPDHGAHSTTLSGVRSRGADQRARPTTLNESRSRGADLSPAPDHGAHSTTLSGVRSRGADQRARPTTLNESRSRGADHGAHSTTLSGVRSRGADLSPGVKGYALSFIQDPVEPNLQFLGTENGLWVSGDDGGSWRQVRNGFPSVSTMDLKIQRRESALIIGTFGRAIWVLDDLKSLRELVARPQVQRRLRALPMNNAVQVKGRFINPPGNIWTGFHTTFEGENRVFQRTEIPFYLDIDPDATVTVAADIYNASGAKINTVTRKDVGPGLQYLTWRLDEAANGGGDEESRGIPVLPGDYRIIVRAGNDADTTRVTVIPDPRFDLDPVVDEKLYAYQKAVAEQAARLSALLAGLDDKTEKLTKVLRYLKDLDEDAPAGVSASIAAMLATIRDTRALGQTPRPTERQIGAWQSYVVTAHAKVREAQGKALSRMTAPSAQDWATVEQAEALIEDFEQEVERFGLAVWGPFAAKLKTMAFLPGVE